VYDFQAYWREQVVAKTHKCGNCFQWYNASVLETKPHVLILLINKTAENLFFQREFRTHGFVFVVLCEMNFGDGGMDSLGPDGKDIDLCHATGLLMHMSRRCRRGAACGCLFFTPHVDSYSSPQSCTTGDRYVTKSESELLPGKHDMH
jgi:hypothetical protein